MTECTSTVKNRFFERRVLLNIKDTTHLFKPIKLQLVFYKKLIENFATSNYILLVFNFCLLGEVIKI